MVFFVLTGGLVGNLFQFADSIANRSKRYGIGFLEHVELLVLLFSSVIMIFSSL